MPKSLKKTREENTITKPENKENPSSRSQSLYPPCYEIALADSQLAQQKLKMGQQDDQYEREADAIADKVVRGNPKDFPLAKQITPLDGANSESGFQTVPASVEKQINASKGGGVPLPEHTRVQMEEAFGVDFSGVRIHTNRQGIEINNVLNSKAFTYQGNIYFNHLNNKFNTFEEQKLVAHELTHTLQQTNGQPTIQTKSTKSKRKRNPKKRRYRRKKRGWNREEVASDHMIVLFKPFADPKKYLHFQSYVYSAILRHMEFMNLPLHWGPDLLGSKHQYRRREYDIEGWARPTNNFKNAVWDKALKISPVPQYLHLDFDIVKGATWKESSIMFRIREKDFIKDKTKSQVEIIESNAPKPIEIKKPKHKVTSLDKINLWDWKQLVHLGLDPALIPELLMAKAIVNSTSFPIVIVFSQVADIAVKNSIESGFAVSKEGVFSFKGEGKQFGLESVAAFSKSVTVIKGKIDDFTGISFSINFSVSYHGFSGNLGAIFDRNWNFVGLKVGPGFSFGTAVGIYFEISKTGKGHVNPFYPFLPEDAK